MTIYRVFVHHDNIKNVCEYIIRVTLVAAKLPHYQSNSYWSAINRGPGEPNVKWDSFYVDAALMAF